MDLRKEDYKDEMDGGWNWLKIVTIRDFDLSVFCCQKFLVDWLVGYVVHLLINYLEENHKYTQYSCLIGAGVV
jgi:hypothetical protein